MPSGTRTRLGLNVSFIFTVVGVSVDVALI